MSINRLCFIILLLLVCASGCTSDRLGLNTATGGNAALAGQFKAFDASSGRGISFADVAARAARADVILFGEEHYNAVCNALEAQLLAALANRRRPAALAMEFLERDAQASVDGYLAGRVDEEAFIKDSRQSAKYVSSHRPLIELCKRGSMPVVAANTPRRLARDYRTSGLSYGAFRAARPAADQSLLPGESADMEGDYWQRYLDAMKEHPMPAPTTRPAAGASMSADTPPPTSRPTHTHGATHAAANAGGEHPMKKFYRVQLLWDDTMAESIATFRTTYPDHRVMLVVGSFHVAHDGGTLHKYRQRRPHDRICTLVFRACQTLPLEIAPKDRQAGDVVIYGMTAKGE